MLLLFPAQLSPAQNRQRRTVGLQLLSRVNSRTSGKSLLLVVLLESPRPRLSSEKAKLQASLLSFPCSHGTLPELRTVLCAEMSRALFYTLLCKFDALSTHMSTTKTLSVTCYSTPWLQNPSCKPSFIYFIVIWNLLFWAFWLGSPRCFTNMPCSFLCVFVVGSCTCHACMWAEKSFWNQFSPTIMWDLGRHSCHQLGSRCLNLLSHPISTFPAKYVSFYIIE